MKQKPDASLRGDTVSPRRDRQCPCHPGCCQERRDRCSESKWEGGGGLGRSSANNHTGFHPPLLMLFEHLHMPALPWRASLLQVLKSHMLIQACLIA